MPQFEDSIQDNKLQILGKLTASLLHEIRNPLSAIKMNLDYLDMIETELPTEAIESVLVCKNALSRIQYLMDNVLTFTKKNFNGARNCSINEITNNAFEIMFPAALKKNIKLLVSLDDQIPHGFYDRGKLLQVFLNLITNAIESCENGGEIVIKTSSQNSDYVIWEISDTGVGINEDDKDKIFQDFYTNKEKGTGLGLSVCKMLLQEYQADLYFESTQGVGTKFFIKFNPNLMQNHDEI
ncbi:MAG TPA: HAMP domain-containing sensor histidine kinase [Ignavibacteriaceae bacterium]|nr:HAMP domain-containing sensor histidine kinase [Ignavibacteriaceae bacterium]